MIRKYQGAGKPNRFGNFLTNATLRSAVNENPSIATSTGYEVNPDTGAVTQDPAALDKTARPELANLRNNLAVMSGTAYAAPAAPALVNAAVSNPITTGKFLTSMLGGMAVDEGVRTYTGFDGGGDLLYNKSGTRHLVEKLPEDMQQKVAPASKFLGGFANPGFYTEGITNQLYRGAKEVVPAVKQLVKEAEAVNYAGRKADANAVPKNVGGAPAQKGTGYHQSNEPITEFKFPFAENGASATHGTSPHVIYMSGSPARTGFLADRNFTNRFQVNLKKPMVQVGELNSAGKNASRNQLIDYAQSAGADGLVLDGIADNTLQNQKILLDFNPENYRHLSTSHKLTTSELAGLPKGTERTIYNNLTEIVDDAKAFANKYGYELSDNPSISEIKDMYRQHNRFTRSVSLPYTEEQLIEYADIPGIAETNSAYDAIKNLTPIQQAQYLATHGYPMGSGISGRFAGRSDPNFGKFIDATVFVGPDTRYSDTGLTAYVRRPFSFRDPLNGRSSAEFKVSKENPGDLSQVKTGDAYYGNTDYELKLATKNLFSDGLVDKTTLPLSKGLGDNINLEKSVQSFTPDINKNESLVEFDPKYITDEHFDINAALRDIQIGRKDAVDFLGSDIKSASDKHNKELAARVGLSAFRPYKNANIRASVPMKRNTFVAPDNDSSVGVGDDNNGFGVTPDMIGEKGLGVVTSVFNDPTLDRMTISLRGNPGSSGFHETLHRGSYGDSPTIPIDTPEKATAAQQNRALYNGKTKHLLKDSYTGGYLSQSSEAAANALEFGRLLGLKGGQPYPGADEAKRIFSEGINSGSPKLILLDNYKGDTKPKRVGDALTGNYYTLPILGILGAGTTNFTNNDNSRTQ